MHRLSLALAGGVAEHGLIVVASLLSTGSRVRGPQDLWHAASVVSACGLGGCILGAPARSLRTCGTQASLLCGMWDLPGPGIERVSPCPLCPEGDLPLSFVIL